MPDVSFDEKKSTIPDDIAFWTESFAEAEEHRGSSGAARRLQRGAVMESVNQLRKLGEEANDPTLQQTLRREISRGRQLARDMLSPLDRTFRVLGKLLTGIALVMGVRGSVGAIETAQGMKAVATEARREATAFSAFHISETLPVMEEVPDTAYRPAEALYQDAVHDIHETFGATALPLVTKSDHHDFFQTYVQYGNQLQNNVIGNFETLYAKRLAEDTGRSSDQLHFTTAVLRRGFFSPAINFGGVSEVFPEAHHLFDSEKHPEWYRAQFKTSAEFVDRMYTEYGQDLPPDQKNEFREALTDYVRSELIVRAEMERISERFQLGDYERVVTAKSDPWAGKTTEPLVAELEECLQHRELAHERVYDILEATEHMSKKEAREATLLSKHGTLVAFHELLTSALVKTVDSALLPGENDMVPVRASVAKQIKDIEHALQELEEPSNDLDQMITIAKR